MCEKKQKKTKTKDILLFYFVSPRNRPNILICPLLLLFFFDTVSSFKNVKTKIKKKKPTLNSKALRVQGFVLKPQI